MYVDKLDGKIAAEFYERKAEEWRAQQDQMAREVDEHRAAETGQEVDVRGLAQRTRELFQLQPATEKRKLLDAAVAACSWKDGTVTPDWRVPFGQQVWAA